MRVKTVITSLWLAKFPGGDLLVRLKLGLLHYNRLVHQELAKNYIKKPAEPHYLDKAKSHNVDQTSASF